MTVGHTLRNECLISALALIAGLACTRLDGQSINDSVLSLTPEAFATAKLHLPSYLPSVRDQVMFQSKVPLRQEITVQWSMEAGETVGAHLVLVKRWRRMEKLVPNQELQSGNEGLLVIAATPTGEIRALGLCPDMRNTTGELNLRFPEDGQISKLLFFNIISRRRLNQVAEIQLGRPDGAPRIVSRSIRRY